MIKSHLLRGMLICLAAAFLSLSLYILGAFDALELKMLNFRFLLRGDRPVSEDIVVVVIDEPSIAEIGRWPWPRSTHGEMITKLSQGGASVVGFDTLLTETDDRDKGSDRRLARDAGRFGHSVFAFFFEGGIDNVFGHNPVFPYDALRDSSEVGFVNLDPDDDGVTRRASLYALVSIGDGEFEVYPSFSVAVLSESKRQSIDELSAMLPVQHPFSGNKPQHFTNRMLINYSYDSEKPFGYTYPFYSYVDVLNNRIPSDVFKDKIVLVGATAAGLYDLKAIPFASLYAGVMIHANVIDNLLSQNFLTEWSPLRTLFFILMIGIILGAILPRLSPWKQVGAFSVLIVLCFSHASWAFSDQNSVVPMVPPMAAAFGGYGGLLFYRLLIEEREKRKIKGSFRQYLSPKIIDVLTKDPSKLQLGGEEREVSIFFLDIAGFTTMSEALKPTQLVEVMNHCLTTFSRIILKHDGLINKYIGDCIMAFWNAPADQPNHASNACLAALECLEALPSLNKSFQEKGLPTIDCRIGINTGTAVVGNMGSLERFDYTVMGDPVNLASRLEGANKPYRTHIMVSDTTFELAKGEIEARDLDLIRVKGKKEPRKVYEVLSKKGELSREWQGARGKYHEALTLYRKKDFQEAIHVFNEVFDYQPNDYVTRLYLERARGFQGKPPPANWDGVFEMTTK